MATKPKTERPTHSRQSGYYFHASSARNKASILKNGLMPNSKKSKQTGYWLPLVGISVTNDPASMDAYLADRDMVDNHLLVVVDIPVAFGVPDEEALHACLVSATDRVLETHGLTHEAAFMADDGTGADSPVWKDILHVLDGLLGEPDLAALDTHHDLLNEFVRAWINEHVYGMEADEWWWAEAKEAFVRTYPDMGNRRTLRIEQPIMFSGDPRVVAVLAVRDGVAKIVAGTVPDAVRSHLPHGCSLPR